LWCCCDVGSIVGGSATVVDDVGGVGVIAGCDVACDTAAGVYDIIVDWVGCVDVVLCCQHL